MFRKHHQTTILLRSFMILVLFLAGSMSSVLASTPVTAGYRDFSYGTSGNSTPTGEKPESKLWWNDGYWWGSLYNSSAQAYHIYRLDWNTQDWVDTGTLLDDRNSSKADTLWDGQHLYVVSHVFTNTGKETSSGSWGRLYRYSYDTGSKTYSLDSGFPVYVTNGKSETLVLAKDSTGQLWVTYVENSQVYVNRTHNGDTDWGTPFVLPASSRAINVSSDDISSVIAFQGNKIGVMWSNQLTSMMYFAVHLDGDPDDVWQPEQTALPGPNCDVGACADDHINLKSLQSDGSGRVFAAVKTSLSASNAPLIMLLVRDLNGNWNSVVFGRKSDHHTRPIVLLDEEHGKIYMFATSPESGGAIYYKTADINNPSFPLGLGDPFILSNTDLNINNATSTKQNLNSTTGLVVLASDKDSHYYLHNFLDLGGSGGGGGGGGNPPQITSFSPTSGPVGTTVTVNGSGFTGATEVDFAGTPASTFTVSSDTNLTAVVPDGATTGPIGVTNAYGSSSSSQSFTVTQGSSELTFTPTDDTYVKSSRTSQNFGTDTVLKVKQSSTIIHTYLKFDVGGISAPVVSARVRLYVTDSSDDGGTLFSTSNFYAGSTTDSWTETGLNWSNAPDFGAMFGSAGAVTTGHWAEFDITDFVRTQGNGIYSFEITSQSSNSVFYSSKEGAQSPEMLVTLDLSGGGGGGGGNPPQITSFSPTSGPVGTTVSVQGSGFTGASEVDFGGTPASSFSVSSDTNLTAVVPDGATTGPIGVTNSYGSSSSSQSFTVTSSGGNPPQITSFSPTGGPVGTTVTVYGSGFTDTFEVDFAGTPASNFVVDSDGVLTAVVPSGATTGPISITNPAGTSSSSQEFTVTQNSSNLTFTPTDDALVKSSRTTQNYGIDPSLQVKLGTTIVHTYLKFDVNGLSGTVASALVRLYVTDPSPDGGSIFSVSDFYAGSSTDPWTETGLTWDNAPDLPGGALDSVGAADTGMWVEFDVTNLVMGGGNRTYSFAIASQSSNSVFYSSKEGSASPQLLITMASP